MKNSVTLIIFALGIGAGYFINDFAPTRLDTCRKAVLAETAKQVQFSDEMAKLQPAGSDFLRAMGK